jgi:hypothetical protein
VKSLQFLEAEHSLDELQQAIREKGLLGKRTRESRRTYWRLISWRFLTPPESAVVSALAGLSCLGADDPVLRGALYFHFCLADRLTFDVATDLLWTLQQQGRGIINVAEVESYIRAGIAEHPEVATWSGRTLKRLASSLLSSAEGKSAKGVLEAPDFRLWGLTRQEVGTRLAKLSQGGVLRFEWSGDIAGLDLGEEPFDAYARRLGQETHRT